MRAVPALLLDRYDGRFQKGLGSLLRLAEEFAVQFRSAVADRAAADPIVQSDGSCYDLIDIAGVARDHDTAGIDKQTALRMNERYKYTVLVGAGPHHHFVHFPI